MVVLTGNTLGKRQKQLNLKVRQAVQESTKLDDIKEEDGIDVNTLIKIDLAANYREIDYVLSILKCGDSLFISKVVKKCGFMYEDEYSNFINPNYLHNNIFPVMSSKMKIKLLTEISIRNLNEERSQLFFEYCINDKNNNCAFKFLRNASLSFKKDLIRNKSSIVSEMINSSDVNLKSFVKESFELAMIILEHINMWTMFTTLLKLTYLFPICNYSYINLIEKFIEVKTNYYQLFSREISDTILKKYKSKVNSKPVLYVHILNKKSIAQYTTADEARVYLEAILPNTSQDFFRKSFIKSYEFLINILKPEDKFSDIKELFNKKYPGEPFEMSADFYYQGLYELMTQAEKETWALQHMESGGEILGPNEGYLWCKFLNFSKAFPIIKSHVHKSSVRDTRTDMLVTLIYSARNQQDVKQLLDYYYERHVNETAKLKEYFLRTVHNHWNVFTFETDCWTVYNKILCSLGIYESATNSYSYTLEELVAVSLFYHISHKLILPKALTEKLETVFIDNFYRPHFNLLNEVQRNVVLQFLLEFYVDQINVFAKNSNNFTTITKENMYSVEHLCTNTLNLLQMYKKKKDDIPEILMHFFDHYPTVFTRSKFYSKPKEMSVLGKKILKDDAKFIIDSFYTFTSKLTNKRNIQDIRSFVRALQVYYSYDIAKDFAKLLLDFLENADTNVSETRINTIVYILFQIVGDKKTEFMLKYAPKNPKIEHDQKDMKAVRIQKAICKFSCFSRPPVANQYMKKYIVGDYLQYSYHVFWVNLSRLPRPQLIEFIASLLDTPISVQKQAINIAFKCFNLEDLVKTVSCAWSKSKNTSLRMVLYSNTLSKMIENEDDAQDKLFEILISFTKTLTESDYDIYNLILRDKIPSRFRGRYIETVWNTLNKTPINKQTTLILNSTIRYMEGNIALMNRKYIDNIIDQHILLLSFDKKDKEINNETALLEDAKWSLFTTYVNHFKDDKSMEYVKTVLTKCLEEWNNINTFNKIEELKEFAINKIINQIKYSSFEIVNLIIKTLEEKVALPQRYNIIFTLKLADAVIKTLKYTEHTALGDCSNSNDVYKYLLIYATNLTDLIKDIVVKKLFYRSFCKELAIIVTDNINYIADKLCFTGDRNSLFCYLAAKLGETKMFETNMLAVYMLSTIDSKKCREHYVNAVQTLLDFKDDEISFLVYNLIQSSPGNDDIEIFSKRTRYN